MTVLYSSLQNVSDGAQKSSNRQITVNIVPLDIGLFFGIGSGTEPISILVGATLFK